MHNAPPPLVNAPPPMARNAPPSTAYGYGPLKTNGLAIASMVVGILWLYWIGSVLALVFGYVARSQIDRSGGLEGGRGMAIAGIVLGWVGVGILLIILIAGVAASS
jgi:hypothetical protein